MHKIRVFFTGLTLGLSLTLAVLWAINVAAHDQPTILTIHTEKVYPVDISLRITTGLTEDISFDVSFLVGVDGMVTISGTEIVTNTQSLSITIDTPTNVDVMYQIGNTNSETVYITTPTPTAVIGKTTSKANLRAGPGTNFKIAGSVDSAEIVTLVGASEDGSWFLLDTNAWIAAFLVSDVTGPIPTLSPTSTVTATHTPIPTNTPVATSTPTPKPFQSGGLGEDRTMWEKNHVKTGPNSLGYLALGTPYDRLYDVMFWDTKVWNISIQWDEAEALSLADVRAHINALLPLDSQFVESYGPPGRPETVVDLFYSKSLIDRFPDDSWPEGEPGNFIVLYHVYDGIVTMTIIATGNFP